MKNLTAEVAIDIFLVLLIRSFIIPEFYTNISYREFAQNPVQAEEEEDKSDSSDKDTEDPQTKIRFVFQYYTSFGDRKNMSYIQSTKVQKMCKESGIIDKKVTKTDVDLLFMKINKSKPNMYYEDFLKLLYEFATLKYGGDKMDALKQLLDDHIFKKYEEIRGVVVKTKELEYDETANEVYENAINVIYDIYHSYFTNRIDKVDKAHTDELLRCEKFMYEFLRDFEICPKLLSKTKVHTIWTHVLASSKAKKTAVYKEASKKLSKNYDIKEENKHFTFARYLDFLVLLSIEAFKKKGKAVVDAQSLVWLLERLESSEGFANFEGKMVRTKCSSSSLLPPESVYTKLSKLTPKVETAEVSRDKDINKILDGTHITTKVPSSTKEVKKTSGKLAPVNKLKKKKLSDNVKPKKVADEMNFDDDYSDAVKDHIPALKRIFSYYCGYGNKGNSSELKGSLFQKVLKDAKIIK
jgi:hypothetical protein